MSYGPPVRFNLPIQTSQHGHFTSVSVVIAEGLVPDLVGELLVAHAALVNWHGDVIGLPNPAFARTNKKGDKPSETQCPRLPSTVVVKNTRHISSSRTRHIPAHEDKREHSTAWFMTQDQTQKPQLTAGAYVHMYDNAINNNNKGPTTRGQYMIARVDEVEMHNDVVHAFENAVLYDLPHEVLTSLGLSPPQQQSQPQNTTFMPPTQTGGFGQNPQTSYVAQQGGGPSGQPQYAQGFQTGVSQQTAIPAYNAYNTSYGAGSSGSSYVPTTGGVYGMQAPVLPSAPWFSNGYSWRYGITGLLEWYNGQHWVLQ